MTLFMISAILLLTIVGEMIREQSIFNVFRYTICHDKLSGISKQGKKLVFLSDMHNQVYGISNAKVLSAIRREEPDLILIGGDMLVSKEGCSYHDTLAFIKQLPKICPVYYALGNHEQRMKEKPEWYQASYQFYKEGLQEAGVCFLENEHVTIDMDDVSVCLYGLEIPRRCYAHVGKEVLNIEEITTCIGTPDSKHYNVLLAHHPGYMHKYLQWGADLTLSGHFHGGLVHIPGFRGVVAPNLEFFPKYSGGAYKEKNADIVVSRGLGTHTIRIRLFNPAELTVITLTGQDHL